MSLHVLAKKTRALRGSSHNKRFAQYMTGSRNNMGGCCRTTVIAGPRTRCGMRCLLYKTAVQPKSYEKAIPKVPIKQMGYGLYLRRPSGQKLPGLLAGRLISKKIGPTHQSPSLYVEQKKINVLKKPSCCGHANILLNSLGEMNEGILFMYCTYTFKWLVVGDILKIGEKPVIFKNQITINLCKCMKKLPIVLKDGRVVYLSIFAGPTRCSNLGCGSKQCECTKKYSLHQKACCITTKDLTTKSSSDYIHRIKGQRMDPNPPTIRAHGGKCRC